MITRITVFGIALVVMIGAAGQAQAQEDFSRPGFYMGAGFDLRGTLFDSNPDDRAAYGFDAVFGYRVMPNLAAEAEIEFLSGDG